MKKETKIKKDFLTHLLMFEEGELQDHEVITLFQEMIDSGIVWKLQGSYGRMASDLIRAGHCYFDQKAVKNV
jgi:hypothetical protein